MWIFEALQATALATFVRESPSMFGYTAFLSLHAMGLAIAVGLSATVSLRFLGVAKSLPLYPMRRVYPWIWLGLIVNTLSGFGLFAAAAATLVTSAMFLIKMACVVLGSFAAWYTGRLAFSGGPDIEHGPVSGRVRALAAITLLLWLVALVTGRLTGYPYLVQAYLGI
jgi:hypothetical protein